MSATLSLIVTERRQECRDVVSITLCAADGGVLPEFLAGQHLPLRLNLPARAVATYTISSPPRQRGHYRISVKRAPDGKGGSAFLHDHAPVGTILQAAPPRGSFTVADSQKPLLFLTGGIGITPALAMLADHLARGTPARPVIFIHACNGPDHIGFGQELVALAAAHRDTKIIIVQADGGTVRPWQAGEIGMAQGFVTRALLQTHVPLDDYDSYLCGPPAFMAAMRDLLRDLGRPDGTVRQENFAGAAAQAPAQKPVPPPATTAAEVTFALSGLSAAWDDTATLLDFAEAQGLAPEFSCRAGVCGSCSCKLDSGAVEYVIDPLDAPEKGYVLLCCAKPKGSITLML